MNKRISIFIIVSLSFIGASYVPKVEPENIFFGIRTVVIDAGHGGKDPGCLGITTSKEKEVALGIALKLGKYIEEKTPDVKVIFTRKTDIFLDLDERAAIANKNKADLFICIHANTACSINKNTKQKTCNEEVFGTETYVMGLHKTNANLNVARRENEAILLEKNYRKRYDGFDPNSETGYILLTMQQNAYLKQSTNFASKIQKQVKEKAGRADKGVQQAGFLVLWMTAMPSVLIETEFLSSTESEKFASSEIGQDKLARAIFSAFRQYKDEVEGKLAKYDDDIENTAPFITEKDTLVEIASQDSSLSLKGEEKNNRSLQGGGQIIYKVQFMSASQRIALLSAQFNGLKEVGEYQDGAAYKYTAGEFKTIDEAMNYRIQMQTKGFKDCFVVKFKDGKRMKNDK